ncbi:hypothetical protein [Streptomyces sp. NPDC048155]|uniref:hypothetical protein n=1 Tax=Streptomyces sp. NPDC048155 TaxID=3154818 RepID=UPI0033F634CB
MASKESTPAGESAGGSSVRRAAAIAVLTEEPTTGLFPATATASAASTASASASAPAPASASASASAAVTAPAAGAEAAATTGTKAGTGGGTATATAVATATPEPAAEEGAAPAAGEEAPTAAATAATGETTPAAPESATAATAETGPAADGTASAAQTRTTTESAAETRLTAAAGSGASGKRTVGLPLGRPNKPMIAAAVLGGLVLIGVPFLISGPDDKPRPPVAGAPAGSSMNPDGSGPGLVPSEQRISAPGVAKAKAKGEHSGMGPGSGGTTEHNAALGGIHESGSGGEDKEDKPSTPKKAPSTKTGKKNTPPAENNKQAPANKPAGVAPDAPAPAITYSHLIGPGCNTPGFAAGDQYTDGNEGWRGSRGSTTSYGCSGFYYSLPMSGSSRSDGIWAQWKFTSGDVKKGNCAVQVYIPNVHDLSYVGGTPAHYTVYRAFTQSSGNQIGTFEINQPSHLGQWVSAGTFPITDNKISVVLDNRGSGANNRHAAAAPVRVNCTAT